MHRWGDKDFHYWKEVNDAAEYIAKFCLKWSRMRVTGWKEKYGTVRVYCSFGWYQLGELFFPTSVFCRGPKILWRIYIPRWVNALIIPYHQWIYRIAYKKAIKKWPMIREEILSSADWNELLEDL